ncbi:hypothetical protein AVEN_238612-1, partial [Araneus ventricosus]
GPWWPSGKDPTPKQEGPRPETGPSKDPKRMQGARCMPRKPGEGAPA